MRALVVALIVAATPATAECTLKLRLADWSVRRVDIARGPALKARPAASLAAP